MCAQVFGQARMEQVHQLVRRPVLVSLGPPCGHHHLPRYPGVVSVHSRRAEQVHRLQNVAQRCVRVCARLVLGAGLLGIIWSDHGGSQVGECRGTMSVCFTRLLVWAHRILSPFLSLDRLLMRRPFLFFFIFAAPGPIVHAVPSGCSGWYFCHFAFAHHAFRGGWLRQ